MLGPSDFRKNLSYILDFYSPEQYALQRLLEYRLPEGFDGASVEGFRRFVEQGDSSRLGPGLGPLFADLEVGARRSTLGLLQEFFSYYSNGASRRSLSFSDCSLGNLIFAGAYLRHGRNFNEATRTLAEMVGSQARLINVSEGECRVLVGLKADGELLESESRLVGRQSPVPIIDTFFLTAALNPKERRELADLPVFDKRSWLKAREMRVQPSKAAVEALALADVIIYGPGTQHSSLLPSYRIARDAILNSRARVKAFVVNLHEDHDIQGFGVTDLVDRALFYLDDLQNARRAITHILYSASGESTNAMSLDRTRFDADATFKGAAIVERSFENHAKPTVHNGYLLIQCVLELARHDVCYCTQGLDIYLDLVGRDLALESINHELVEIPFHKNVDAVSVFVNRVKRRESKGPCFVSFHEVDFNVTFSEVLFVRDWLFNRSSEYLVTLAGDGEYRLRDVLLAIQVLQAGDFGVLFGSRTQSRLQFQTSLRAAYGEGGLMFRLSWLGAFLISALFGVRFGVILSDPLTGFRVYRRSRLPVEFQTALAKRLPKTAIALAKMLLMCKVDISEIPVVYRTFTGFTQPKWRFRRGLKNLLSAFR